MTRERIVICDDHPVFRMGLKAILEREFAGANVDEAGTVDELDAIAGLGETPVLFVLDMSFPGFDLERDVARLRRTYVGASIAIVSMAEDRGSIERAMAAGADGYIAKSVPATRLAAALRDIRDGDILVVTGPDAAVGDEGTASDVNPLSERQRQVLRLLAAGQTNKEIARSLAIAPSTARMHVSEVLKALGVSTRSAAAALSGRYFSATPGAD